MGLYDFDTSRVEWPYISMVAYERVFFSHTYRVNYVMNYFCFN